MAALIAAEPASLAVRVRSDVYSVRSLVIEQATDAGFTTAEVNDLALAATELATNLVRYAIGGVMTVRRLAETDRGGIEIVSEDEGPGIEDKALAMIDGFSTGGGLGGGLSTVVRMVDEFSIANNGRGTRVVLRKWTHA